VPESLRWLIVNKRSEQAQQTVQRIARINRKKIPDNIQLPNYQDNTSSERAGDIRLLFRPGYRILTVVLWFIRQVNCEHVATLLKNLLVLFFFSKLLYLVNVHIILRYLKVA